MLPVELDGARVMLAGVQETGTSGFRYLRLPVDDDSSLGDFVRLRAALADSAARKLAAERLVSNYGGGFEERRALQISTERALDTFAKGGLVAISNFLEKNVPEAEQRRAADVIIRLLGSSIAELRGIGRERAGLMPMPIALDNMEAAAEWSRLAVAALSDLALYPSPIMMTLKTFDHVQASVFQVSRTPGKSTVYIGCLLLIIGIFTMFYVKDRRIWVWLRPAETGGAKVMAAMTSQKRTLDFNREFDRFKQALLRLNQGEPTGKP
jgi:cytochrome c biogenesis protein